MEYVEHPVPVVFLDPGKHTQRISQEVASTYQVVQLSQGESTLACLEQLRKRDASLALMIFDAESLLLHGESLLKQINHFPQAKRVVLAAREEEERLHDTLCYMNLWMDALLFPPWTPPAEYVFPVLDDLLESWQSTARRSPDELLVVGYERTTATHEVKQFLAGYEIPFRSAELKQARTQTGTYPQVLFPDGTRLYQPSPRDLARRLNIRQLAQSLHYDLVIVGAGPAGLAAATYGASEGLHTLLIEQGTPGGQAGSSSRIENYPGFPAGISGADLARRMVAQIHRLQSELISAEVTSLHHAEEEDDEYVITFREGHNIAARAVLLSPGVSYRKLDVPGIDPLFARGVYYGASLTEVESCRGEEVYVVGGANSAGQAALYLSESAAHVTILVRSNELQKSMSRYLINEIGDRSNIEIRANATIKEVGGKDHLETITFHQGQEVETVPAFALFAFIGADPQTEWLSHMVARDDRGFILSGSDVGRETVTPRWPLSRAPYSLETSSPGVFVAGDVRSSSVKRVATSVGEGAMAISSIHQYLNTLRERRTSLPASLHTPRVSSGRQ